MSPSCSWGFLFGHRYEQLPQPSAVGSTVEACWEETLDTYRPTKGPTTMVSFPPRLTPATMLHGANTRKDKNTIKLAAQQLLRFTFTCIGFPVDGSVT